jgi:hypothetical protein
MLAAFGDAKKAPSSGPSATMLLIAAATSLSLHGLDLNGT